VAAILKRLWRSYRVKAIALKNTNPTEKIET
jgi:hypothetical protein